MTAHQKRRPAAALGAALLLISAATGCAGGTSTPAAAATSNTTLTSAVAPAPVVRLSGPPAIRSAALATPTVTASTPAPPPNRPVLPPTRVPAPSSASPMKPSTTTPSSSPPAPTPSPSPSPPPPPVRLPHPSPTITSAAAPQVVANAAAESVAKAWLIGYRQATWTQPVTAWIPRVKPDVTDRLYRSYLPLVGRGGGAEWTRFVAGKCTSTVTDTGAVIPPEAPHTPTMVHVQVAGLLHSACTTGTPPADEPLAATLTVIATATGWRVDAREY